MEMNILKKNNHLTNKCLKTLTFRKITTETLKRGSDNPRAEEM